MKKIFTFILLTSQNIAASNAGLFQRDEYTEEFKAWLQLSEEERKNVIMPRMYEVETQQVVTKNPLFKVRMLKASLDSKYSLKNIIPANVAIRDQKTTNSCWAFAALSSLETNLALSNYKKGVNLSKVYDFSERHMEYATSKTFANNVENKYGYNRQVGSGANFYYSTSYLTNGSGAIPESEMPFEDNEDIIDISQIQNKTVSSQVYDTVKFADYSKQETDEKKAEIMNQIKQHIQNYGSVFTQIHGNTSSATESCYNNNTGAKYCDNSTLHSADHAVSIIGWDDNYSVDNFSEDAKPTANGAWIVRNSWGEKLEDWKLSELKESIYTKYTSQCNAKGWNSAEEIPNEFLEQNGYTIENDTAYKKYGDNGIIYISYEDDNISKSMFGIVKAADTVDYDYIYQYDKFSPVTQMTLNGSKLMLSNIFNKKTNGTEYLTQVSLYAPQTYTCKVYVNPNGTSRAKSDMELVALKAGESETFNAGYHTLEFSKPIELKADSFAVVIEVQSDSSSITFSLETKIESLEQWNSVTVENGKCFIAAGNDLENCEWIDLSKWTELNSSLINGDSSIKAFTTTELIDESLKNIKITTPPNKTSYFEGENFDKTGMVVTANYNSKINPSLVLDDSSYSITNGTNLKEGQTSVTISYEDKSVEQAITVIKNDVVELKIKTPATKTEYKEGYSFDTTGMVIEATYKNGTTKVISDYNVKDGNNLTFGQTYVTISYGEKTVTQPITVASNPLQKIEITKAPNKTKYVVGQNFDSTGMIVSGEYEDGLIQEILNYTVENGTNLTKEQTTVTIKYKEKVAMQSIIVEEKTIIKISISKNPTKMKYIQNKEELDLTDGILKIEYNDNSMEEISLTADEIKTAGFNNKNIGKNTITITYQSHATTLDVEIIEEYLAKNTNFNQAKCNINSIKYYTFSNKNTKEYAVIDITINEVIRNMNNDSYEYYYYLSANKDESNIKDWIKIDEEQKNDNMISFKINTKDSKNAEELFDSNTLYLYIKEFVVKGGDHVLFIAKPIEMKTNMTAEIYLDNAKVTNKNSKLEDNTVANGKLPQTGIKLVVIISAIVLIVLTSGICYIRYNKFKDIK